MEIQSQKCKHSVNISTIKGRFGCVEDAFRSITDKHMMINLSEELVKINILARNGA